MPHLQGKNVSIVTVLAENKWFGYLYNAFPHRQFHTLPGCTAKLLPSTCVSSREAVCTSFMMVFSMTRPGCEPTTYRMSG